ncbi:MAG: hypothetical protein FJX72_13100 [Armatimonadetes bacterium]|nr:hypothetical protein [Armatimonadota bacterium]
MSGSYTEFSRRFRAHLRRQTLRVYAAGLLWLIAVAGLVAAAAGVPAGWWIACPASVLAAMLSGMPGSPLMYHLEGGEGRHALPIVADHMNALLAADRDRTIALLRRLLPTLAKPYAPDLTDSQWNGIADVLRGADVERDWELIVAIVNSIGAHGPARLAGAVERYAVGPTSAGPETTVRAAAQASLAVLRARAVREREAATLLRPAEPELDQSRVLVRPVEQSSPQATGLLVRRTDDDG